MKRLLHTAVATAALAAAMLAASATPAGAADTTVSATGCIFASGGQVTRPAGSTIIVRFVNLEANLGILTEWLEAQTTTLALNGSAPIDVSSLYSPPEERPQGGWISAWNYPTGITLVNPGDSMSFTVTVTLSHRLAEVTNGPFGFGLGFEPGPPMFSGPGVFLSGTCTVTAV